MGFAATVDGSTSGVSGANVVAGVAKEEVMMPILEAPLGSPKC